VDADFAEAFAEVAGTDRPTGLASGKQPVETPVSPIVARPVRAAARLRTRASRDVRMYGANPLTAPDATTANYCSDRLPHAEALVRCRQPDDRRRAECSRDRRRRLSQRDQPRLVEFMLALVNDEPR
jgi:hypothetical protein